MRLCIKCGCEVDDTTSLCYACFVNADITEKALNYALRNMRRKAMDWRKTKHPGFIMEASRYRGWANLLMRKF